MPNGATEYFTDHNQLIVSVGSVFLNNQLYSINSTKKTITFDKNNTKDILSAGRIVTIIFIYNDNPNNQFIYAKNITKITDKEYTGSVEIPEPFENYVAANRSFFVTRNGTFLDGTDYVVDKDNNTLDSSTSLSSLVMIFSISFLS